MKFGIQNLFSLHKISQLYSGYYMDSTGAVFSTVRTSKPAVMYGSGLGSRRVLTLSKRSVNAFELIARARAHPDFVKETSAEPVDKIQELTSASRSHASSAAEGLNKKGWVIGQVTEHNGVPHLMFSSKPAIHLTAASVKSELERLAIARPGVKFFSTKIDNVVISGGVIWK